MPIMNIVPRCVVAPVLPTIGHYDELTINVGECADKDPNPPKEIEIAYHCKNDKKGSIPKHGSILPLGYAPVTTIQEVALRTADVNSVRTHLANTILGSTGASKRPRHNWQMSVLSSAKFALCRRGNFESRA
jgi:hypothetical protein